MQKLLEEIKTSPGVMGSCVYTSERGILASTLPSVFTPDTQKRVSNILHRIFKLNETVKLDVNAFEIQYDEALILVKKLCTASSLVILCEPDVNVHLVNMAVSMLTADLLKMIDDCENAPELETAQANLQPATPASPADINSVIQGELSESLAQMKRSLAKCIGPVAGMALESSLKKWLALGTPSKSRLQELAQMLLPEIDDAESRKEFIADLKEIL